MVKWSNVYIGLICVGSLARWLCEVGLCDALASEHDARVKRGAARTEGSAYQEEECVLQAPAVAPWRVPSRVIMGVPKLGCRPCCRKFFSFFTLVMDMGKDLCYV